MEGCPDKSQSPCPPSPALPTGASGMKDTHPLILNPSSVAAPPDGHRGHQHCGRPDSGRRCACGEIRPSRLRRRGAVSGRTQSQIA